MAQLATTIFTLALLLPGELAAGSWRPRSPGAAFAAAAVPPAPILTTVTTTTTTTTTIRTTTNDDTTPAPSASAASGPLNVRQAPFLARADGVTDDWVALQKAIDAAGVPGASFAKNRAGVGQAVYLPSGVYAVSRPLTVQNSREGCDPKCMGGPDCVHNCHPSLRLIGDGMELAVIKAMHPMTAVLIFNGTQPKKGTTAYAGQQHEVEGVKFDAALKANYSVYGASIVESRFRYTAFHRGLIAGAYLGYG